MTDKKQSQQRNEVSKKTYSKPFLKVHGTLKEITKKVSGTRDSGGTKS
jgi:hypothetical protein